MYKVLQTHVHFLHQLVKICRAFGTEHTRALTSICSRVPLRLFFPSRAKANLAKMEWLSQESTWTAPGKLSIASIARVGTFQNLQFHRDGSVLTVPGKVVSYRTPGSVPMIDLRIWTRELGYLSDDHTFVLSWCPS